MATEFLNLNDPIYHEDENPSKPLDSSDTPIIKTDRPQNTPNSLTQAPPPSSTDASGMDGTAEAVDASKVRNGATTVVPVGSSAGNNEPISDIQKKIHRAERFGMPVQLSEKEKRNTRAERFGTVSTSRGADGLNKLEDVKRKARAERFGLNVPPEVSEEEAKKKARLARFASVAKTDAPDTQEEDKRKARAIRFSNGPSGSLSQVNGKGSVEQKAAIAGKPGGVV